MFICTLLLDYMLGCDCAQLCSTLCDSMDYSPSDSSVHGIFQAKILPFPTPGDLPNSGFKPASLASPALAGELFTTAPSGICFLITSFIDYTEAESW